VAADHFRSGRLTLFSLTEGAFGRRALSDRIGVMGQLGRPGVVEVGRRENINHEEAPTAKSNKHHPNASANLPADCLECRMAGSTKSRVSQRPLESRAANPSIRLVRDQNSVAGRAIHKMRFGRMPRTIAIPHTNKISGVGVINSSVQPNNATISASTRHDPRAALAIGSAIRFMPAGRVAPKSGSRVARWPRPVASTD
jgi:hypothetical protein